MHGMLKDEKCILELLHIYGPLKVSQLCRYLPGQDIDRVLYCLERRRQIIRQDGLAIPAGIHIPARPEIIRAFEVVLLFLEDIRFYCPAESPFAITYLKDGRVYDIAAVTADTVEETCRAVDASSADQVVFVADDLDTARRVRTQKPAGICVLEPKLKLYELEGEWKNHYDRP
jgi:hypothetical protein